MPPATMSDNKGEAVLDAAPRSGGIMSPNRHSVSLVSLVNPGAA